MTAWKEFKISVPFLYVHKSDGTLFTCEQPIAHTYTIRRTTTSILILNESGDSGALHVHVRSNGTWCAGMIRTPNFDDEDEVRAFCRELLSGANMDSPIVSAALKELMSKRDWLRYNGDACWYCGEVARMSEMTRIDGRLYCAECCVERTAVFVKNERVEAPCATVVCAWCLGILPAKDAAVCVLCARPFCKDHLDERARLCAECMEDNGLVVTVCCGAVVRWNDARTCVVCNGVRCQTCAGDTEACGRCEEALEWLESTIS